MQALVPQYQSYFLQGFYFLQVPESSIVEEGKDLKSYRDYVNAIIQSVVPADIQYRDYIPFYKTTITQLLEGQIEVSGGTFKPGTNKIVLNRKNASDETVIGYVQDWFLESTKEGRRIAKIKDENTKSIELVNSPAYKIFENNACIKLWKHVIIK